MKKSTFLTFLTLSSFVVNAQFGPQQDINSSIQRPNDAKCYDLDGDGDLDVLVSSQDDNKISWYENDGTGNFGVQNVISTTAHDASFALSADLDGDGDLDAFSTSYVLDRISWHANDGDGNFGPENIITSDVDALSGLSTADLDGDGDLDLVASSLIDDEVVWFENDGAGTFGPKLTISDLTDGASDAFTVDVDGDLDFDVVYYSGADTKIAWFENDGTGTFGPEQIVVSDLTGASGLSASDMDGDGDEDIISGSGPDGKLVWYANDGTGSFGPEQIITTTFFWLSNVIGADLDGDLDYDILASSNIDDKISWYENDGTGSFGGEQIITTLTDAPRTAFVGDIDGDGDSDVISASLLDDKVAWYQNDGTGIFGPQRLVVTDHEGSNNVFAFDIDNDGDMDVISSAFFDDKILWYKNDGEGNFISQHYVAENVLDVRSIYAADIDGDDDLDILSASSEENEIVWYENLDGLGLFGPKQVISTAVDHVLSVYASDLNGDGFIDVLSASEDDDKIAWYENDGTGSFGAQQVISTAAEEPNTVYTADLDGDGDQDVLCTADAEFDDIVAWFENDGTGSFGEIQEIFSETFGTGANDVFAADLDGDGDLDVLSSSNVAELFWDDKILWYENDGAGNFGPEIEITDDINGPNGVFAADLDGDGDQDVLSSALNDHEVVWYENDGTGAFSTKIVIWAAGGASDVYVADLDGNGSPDVLSAQTLENGIDWYENMACLNFATIELEGETDALICSGADGVSLLSDIEGGIFSGTAVAVDEFDPVIAGVGEHIIYYTREEDEEGCSYVDSIVVEVLELPEVTISEPETDVFCLAPYPTGLEGVPVGGDFAGPGISGTDFTPITAGVGEHEVIYSYEDEFGCISSDTVYLTVLDLETPDVVFTPLSDGGYCIDEALVTLDGTPAGGIFDGPGVSGTSFNPDFAGPGDHWLHYTYEDEEGCVNFDSTEVTVWDLPNVIFNDLGDNLFCKDESPVDMSGAPFGGTFSGEGVEAGMFNPASVGEGEYTLYYFFEDGNGCSDIDSVMVNVVDCLGVDENNQAGIRIYPNPFTDHTTISFEQPLTEKHVVVIHNAIGQEVYRNENVTGSSLKIEKGQLGTGVYVLFVFNSDLQEVFSTKLLVE